MGRVYAMEGKKGESNRHLAGARRRGGEGLDNGGRGRKIGKWGKMEEVLMKWRLGRELGRREG